MWRTVALKRELRCDFVHFVTGFVGVNILEASKKSLSESFEFSRKFVAHCASLWLFVCGMRYMWRTVTLKRELRSNFVC